MLSVVSSLQNVCAVPCIMASHSALCRSQHGSTLCNATSMLCSIIVSSSRRISPSKSTCSLKRVHCSNSCSTRAAHLHALQTRAAGPLAASKARYVIAELVEHQISHRVKPQGHTHTCSIFPQHFAQIRNTLRASETHPQTPPKPSQTLPKRLQKQHALSPRASDKKHTKTLTKSGGTSLERSAAHHTRLKTPQNAPQTPSKPSQTLQKRLRHHYAPKHNQNERGKRENFYEIGGLKRCQKWGALPLTSQ